MSREWQLYWADMRHAATKIQLYTSNMDEATFAANELVRDAVLRNLEIIGEAAKHVPQDVRDISYGLDWRRVVGFRNIVAHAYFGIDRAILWNIVSEKISELIDVMDKIDKS